MCAQHGPKITILEKALVRASPRSFTASSSKWPGLVFGRRCLETFGRRVARDDENKYPGASFAPVPAPLWLPDCRPNAKRKSKNISSQETQGESEQVAVEEGSQPMKACSQSLPTSLPLQGRRRDRLVVDWCQSRHSDQTQLDWSRGTSQVKGRKLRTARS